MLVNVIETPAQKFHAAQKSALTVNISRTVRYQCLSTANVSINGIAKATTSVMFVTLKETPVQHMKRQPSQVNGVATNV